MHIVIISYFLYFFIDIIGRKIRELFQGQVLWVNLKRQAYSLDISSNVLIFTI